jgi:hypothetical protein
MTGLQEPTLHRWVPAHSTGQRDAIVDDESRRDYVLGRGVSASSTSSQEARGDGEDESDSELYAAPVVRHNPLASSSLAISTSSVSSFLPGPSRALDKGIPVPVAGSKPKSAVASPGMSSFMNLSPLSTPGNDDAFHAAGGDAAAGPNEPLLHQFNECVANEGSVSGLLEEERGEVSGVKLSLHASNAILPEKAPVTRRVGHQCAAGIESAPRAPASRQGPLWREIAADRRRWALEAERMRAAATASSGGEGTAGCSQKQRSMKKRVQKKAAKSQNSGMDRDFSSGVSRSSSEEGTRRRVQQEHGLTYSPTQEDEDPPTAERRQHMDERMMEARRVLQSLNYAKLLRTAHQHELAAETVARLRKYKNATCHKDPHGDQSRECKISRSPRKLHPNSTEPFQTRAGAVVVVCGPQSMPAERESRAEKPVPNHLRGTILSNSRLPGGPRTDKRKPALQTIAFVSRDVCTTPRCDAAAHPPTSSSCRTRVTALSKQSPGTQAPLSGPRPVPSLVLRGEVQREQRRLAASVYSAASRRKAQQWQRRTDAELAHAGPSAGAGCSTTHSAATPDTRIEGEGNPSEGSCSADGSYRGAGPAAVRVGGLGSSSAAPSHASPNSRSSAGGSPSRISQHHASSADAFCVWNLLRAFRADKAGQML